MTTTVVGALNYQQTHETTPFALASAVIDTVLLRSSNQTHVFYKADLENICNGISLSDTDMYNIELNLQKFGPWKAVYETIPSVKRPCLIVSRP